MLVITFGVLEGLWMVRFELLAVTQEEKASQSQEQNRTQTSHLLSQGFSHAAQRFSNVLCWRHCHGNCFLFTSGCLYL